MTISRKLAGGLAATAITTLIAFGAAAQVDARFVISGEDAAENGEMNMINSATAKAIAEHCEAAAAARDMDMAIVILDNFGNTVHQHRMDGAARYTAIYTAELKAETARLTRRPSKIRMNNVINNPASEVREWNLGYFPNAGGLPIWVGDQIIGFVGVGGMAARPPEWSDEICAYNALTEVIGPQPALVEDIAR
jgi:uncharacterized protein GlcG (DUF336 family)